MDSLPFGLANIIEGNTKGIHIGLIARFKL